jgi:hypothetical protein
MCAPPLSSAVGRPVQTLLQFEEVCWLGSLQALSHGNTIGEHEASDRSRDASRHQSFLAGVFFDIWKTILLFGMVMVFYQHVAIREQVFDISRVVNVGSLMVNGIGASDYKNHAGEGGDLPTVRRKSSVKAWHGQKIIDAVVKSQHR